MSHICYFNFVSVFVTHWHSSTDAQYWYRNSVRPFVCHTPVLYQNGLTVIVLSLACAHYATSAWRKPCSNEKICN